MEREVLITHAIMQQKHLAQSARSSRSASYISNTLRTFTKEPMREQEIKQECMKVDQILIIFKSFFPLFLYQIQRCTDL